MQVLRDCADRMELITGKDFITFPTYEDILYSVKY
jgi:glutamine synthetase type III